MAEKQLHTQLIAPTPIDLTNPPVLGPSSNPLLIPFDGVYWFFKSPDVRPPGTSRQAHASPETVDIRSTDGRPLSIEAHDYLGSLINVDCCSRIQIAVRNADRYPDTVSLGIDPGRHQSAPAPLRIARKNAGQIHPPVENLRAPTTNKRVAEFSRFRPARRCAISMK